VESKLLARCRAFQQVGSQDRDLLPWIQPLLIQVVEPVTEEDLATIIKNSANPKFWILFGEIHFRYQRSLKKS
jgi:hypothetical protein